MGLIPSPIPTFYDRNGDPLNAGYIYVGGTDAITDPITVYWDEALTIPAEQPIRTSGGYPVYQGAPSGLYIAEDECLVTVKDSRQRAVLTNVKGDPFITTAFLASGIGASLVGFIQAGTGAVDRTALAKMRESCVTPEDFGALGDGVADDGPAIQRAFDTGQSVVFTGTKSYRLTATVEFTAHGQKAYFNGCNIVPEGNFNVFSISGNLYACGFYAPIFEATAHTGGYLIHLSNADRTELNAVIGHNPANFLYAERFNLLSLNDCWINNITGDYGIHCYGSNALRSDVLNLNNVTMSSQQVAIGLLVDGNVHTVCTQGLRLVAMRIGVQYKNSSGGTIPLFFFADDLEIDFPEEEGIDLQVGEDFYFTNLYCHGSTTASGIKIAAAVPSGRVIVVDGKITGHALYGIDNPSTRVQIGNYVMSGNGSGDFSGDVYFKSAKIEVDDTYYMRMSAGDPLLNFAVDDFLGFVRGTNTFFVNVAATARFRVTDASNGVEIYVNGALKEVEVGAADSGGVGYRMLRVTN